MLFWSPIELVQRARKDVFRDERRQRVYRLRRSRIASTAAVRAHIAFLARYLKMTRSKSSYFKKTRCSSVVKSPFLPGFPEMMLSPLPIFDLIKKLGILTDKNLNVVTLIHLPFPHRLQSTSKFITFTTPSTTTTALLQPLRKDSSL